MIKDNNVKRYPLSTYIDKDLLLALMKYCDENQQSKVTVINNAIRKYIKK